MNDEHLFLRVGELAAAVGCPMPSISRVECTPRTHLARVTGGTVGPDLHLRSDAEQWCAELRDLMIAQALLAYRMGAHRHRRWFKLADFIAGVVLGGFAVSLWPFQLAAPLAMCAVILLHIAAVAIYSRWFTRRVDRQLLPVLGAAAMAEGMRHLSFPMKPVNVLRWLWSGAAPLASERMRWLQVAAPGTSSVTD
ncbi:MULTISPECIES: hypothetical protein [Kribbella]|uniref:Uncharacterized protein n=1 Tax=Kribbella karoonensis TaxID=324851 RepID=A0ABN2DWJ2_9ACTN